MFRGKNGNLAIDRKLEVMSMKRQHEHRTELSPFHRRLQHADPLRSVLVSSNAQSI